MTEDDLKKDLDHEDSVFLKNLEVDFKPIKITYLFLEVFSKVIVKHNDKEFEEILGITLLKLGYDLEKLTEEVAVDLAERIMVYQKEELQAMSDSAKQIEDSNKSGSKGKGKGFGQDYLEHIKDLSPADKCMVVCEYDYDKAKRLYCEVEKSAADRIVTLYMGTRWQELKTNFEASVLGFGGSLDGKKDKGPSYDMTTEEGQKAAMSQLKSLRF